MHNKFFMAFKWSRLQKFDVVSLELMVITIYLFLNFLWNLFLKIFFLPFHFEYYSLFYKENIGLL